MRSTLMPIKSHRGDVDHRLAGPDDDGLDEEKKAAGDAHLTQRVDGEKQPVFQLLYQLILRQLILRKTSKERAHRSLQLTRSEHQDQQADC